MGVNVYVYVWVWVGGVGGMWGECALVCECEWVYVVGDIEMLMGVLEA